MTKTKKIAKKKKTVEKFRVTKEQQYKDFDCQAQARRHLIECLDCDAITFCSITKVDVEEEQ